MDERTKKLIDTYKTQGSLTTGQIGDVFATTPQIITSASLSNTEAPINVPAQTPSTFAASISGSTQALLDQEQERQKSLEKQQANDIEKAKIEAPKLSMYDKVLNSIGIQRDNLQGRLSEVESQQRGLTSQIGTAKKDITTKGREQFGLDVLESTRRQALQDLKTSQVRELAEMKALEGQNLTGVGAQSAQAGIRRKYGLEQLEAQLSYHLANDDITAAEKTIADRITLETEPLYAQLDLTKNVYDQISGRLSKIEDKEWNLAIDEINRQIKQTEDLTAYKGNIAITAAKNGTPLDSYTQMKLNRAQSMDEVNQVLADSGISLADTLERTLKQEQILTERAQRAKINADTAKVISESIPTTAKQTTEAVTTINDINNILSSEALNNTFGLLNVAQRNLPGTAAYGLSAQVNNLVNKLALAARGQLKGQGAVSDFEGRMLKEAQTALTLNMSPDQAKKELAKVRGALATSSGLKALVKITNPKTKESALVEVSQEGIDQAIKDGNQVEYQ